MTATMDLLVMRALWVMQAPARLLAAAKLLPLFAILQVWFLVGSTTRLNLSSSGRYYANILDKHPLKFVSINE
jgi:hypothetical protein